MHYLNPTTGETAKVLGVDDRTGMATVVIDDKAVQIVWDEFIRKFSSLSNQVKMSINK